MAWPWQKKLSAQDQALVAAHMMNSRPEPVVVGEDEDGVWVTSAPYLFCWRPKSGLHVTLSHPGFDVVLLSRVRSHRDLLEVTAFAVSSGRDVFHADLIPSLSGRRFTDAHCLLGEFGSQVEDAAGAAPHPRSHALSLFEHLS